MTRPDDDPPLELVAERVVRRFEARTVLDSVDLAIRQGEIVAIVGASGCGKTVLLDHLIGHLQPDAGRILAADHEAPGTPLVDLAELDEPELDRVRRHRAVVFQRNALFSGTVFENIAMWLREVRGLDDEAILPIARDVLERVGFDDDVDAVLDRDRDALSGGMAKRVAIARALAMTPMTILYDEPTTGLDPEHAGRVHDLIGEAHVTAPAPGVARTSIVVTHDRELLRRLQPRIVMLHEGRVHFDGSYEAFGANDSEIVRPYFDYMPVLQLRR